ncbi:serine hydrolase domain-containing protein, partial [Aphanothece microscopica]|uniref:serine hydrolase domain-containing protein n=1 Tax=Aphanothece microscopica TaxID=1049561 RepID=UPI003984D6D3
LAPGLVRDPGVRVSYSNYATALLGLIVEDVTGEPIEAYFRREIWRPLGMDSARFQRGLTLEPGTATAYSKQPSGAYEPDHFIAFNPLYWPVGAVSLTLDDAVRYARFHLERARGVEGPVLSAAQHRRLTSVMRANHPDTGGFGFQIMSYEWNGRRLIGHGGTWVGYESMLLVSPDDDMALFFSIVGPRGMGNIEATRLLVPRLFCDDQPPRPAAAGTGVALADYAGVYRPAMRTDTRAEGVLAYLGGGDAAVVEATPDGLMIAGDGPFKPVGDDLFFHAQAKQTGANPFAMPRMAFYRDADGKVAGLTSHLGFTPLERVGPLGDPRWAASGLRWIGFALLLALPALFWPRRSVAELGVKAAALAPAACVFAIAPVLTMAMGPGGLGAYLIEGRTLRFAAASALANLTVLCAVVLTIAATIWIRDGGRRPVWARAHLTLTAALTCAASAILIAVHLVGFGRA